MEERESKERREELKEEKKKERDSKERKEETWVGKKRGRRKWNKGRKRETKVKK